MITEKEFGQALEQYYKRNLHNKQFVLQFLCNYFNINDKSVRWVDGYVEGLEYFKERYVR